MARRKKITHRRARSSSSFSEVRRVSVVGVSGSGKTTVASMLSEALEVPHLELDSIFHQPGWQPRDPSDFRRDVAGFVAQDGWVVDGNYGAVRDLVWDRADTVVWLDPPRAIAMLQVVSRTLRRVLLRRELWNGNREVLSNLWQRNPEENIVLWTWKTHGRTRARYEAAREDPRWSNIRFVHLRNRKEVMGFVVELRPG